MTDNQPFVPSLLGEEDVLDFSGNREPDQPSPPSAGKKSLSSGTDPKSSSVLSNPIYQAFYDLGCGGALSLMVAAKIFTYAILVFQAPVVQCIRGSVTMSAAVGVMIMMVALIAKSRYPYMVVVPDMFSAPYIITMSYQLATAIEDPNAARVSILVLVLFVYTGSSVLHILMASFRLLRFAEFLPYPVFCGLFSAVGLTIVQRSILFAPGLQIIPTMAVAISLSLKIFKTKEVRPALSFATVTAISVFVFYITAYIRGISIDDLRSSGWLVDSPIGQEKLKYQTLPWLMWLEGENPLDFRLIQWDTIIRVCGSSVGLLLILIALRRSMQLANLNRLFACRAETNYELALHGYAQLLTVTLLGTFGGVMSGPDMVRIKRMHGGEILPSIICILSLLCITMARFNGVDYVPKFVYMGILANEGIMMLDRFLLMPYRLAGFVEWVAVAGIAVTAFFDIFQGFFLGAAISLVLFSVRFYRTGCVKMTGTGLTIRSTADRSDACADWLCSHGEKIRVIQLRGTVAFANVTTVLDIVADMLEMNENKSHLRNSPQGRFRLWLRDLMKTARQWWKRSHWSSPSSQSSSSSSSSRSTMFGEGFLNNIFNRGNRKKSREGGNEDRFHVALRDAESEVSSGIIIHDDHDHYRNDRNDQIHRNNMRSGSRDIHSGNGLAEEDGDDYIEGEGRDNNSISRGILLPESINIIEDYDNYHNNGNGNSNGNGNDNGNGNGNDPLDGETIEHFDESFHMGSTNHSFSGVGGGSGKMHHDYYYNSESRPDLDDLESVAVSDVTDGMVDKWRKKKINVIRPPGPPMPPNFPLAIHSAPVPVPKTTTGIIRQGKSVYPPAGANMAGTEKNMPLGAERELGPLVSRAKVDESNIVSQSKVVPSRPRLALEDLFIPPEEMDENIDHNNNAKDSISADQQKNGLVRSGFGDQHTSGSPRRSPVNGNNNDNNDNNDNVVEDGGGEQTSKREMKEKSAKTTEKKGKGVLSRLAAAAPFRVTFSPSTRYQSKNDGNNNNEEQDGGNDERQQKCPRTGGVSLRRTRVNASRRQRRRSNTSSSASSHDSQESVEIREIDRDRYRDGGRDPSRETLIHTDGNLDNGDDLERQRGNAYVDPWDEFFRPEFLIIDMALVVGVDASALDTFKQIADYCKRANVELYSTGLEPHLNLLEKAGVFQKENRFPDLDTVLCVCEDKLLERHNVMKETDNTAEEDEEEDGDQEDTNEEEGLNNDRDNRDNTNAANAPEYGTITRPTGPRSSPYDPHRGFIKCLELMQERHNYHHAVSDEAIVFLRQLVHYVRPMKLREGDVIMHTTQGSPVDLDEDGLFFIESGSIVVQRNPDQSVVLTMRSSRRRRLTVAPRMLRLKHRTFQLSRLGPGWLLGANELCSQYRSLGQFVVQSRICRAHFLPFRTIKNLEREQPLLALRVHQLASMVLADRYDRSKEQLAHLVDTIYAPPMKVSSATEKALKKARFAFNQGTFTEGLAGAHGQGPSDSAAVTGAGAGQSHRGLFDTSANEEGNFNGDSLYGLNMRLNMNMSWPMGLWRRITHNMGSKTSAPDNREGIKERDHTSGWQSSEGDLAARNSTSNLNSNVPEADQEYSLRVGDPEANSTIGSTPGTSRNPLAIAAAQIARLKGGRASSVRSPPNENVDDSPFQPEGILENRSTSVVQFGVDNNTGAAISSHRIQNQFQDRYSATVSADERPPVILYTDDLPVFDSHRHPGAGGFENPTIIYRDDVQAQAQAQAQIQGSPHRMHPHTGSSHLIGQRMIRNGRMQSQAGTGARVGVGLGGGSGFMGEYDRNHQRLI